MGSDPELGKTIRSTEALALRDALTGLPNRTLLEDRVEQALARARRTGSAFALILVDLDGFKEVNDFRGHRAGDAVLKTIARRLESVVRASDTVARVGGDEFVILSLDARNEKTSRSPGGPPPARCDGRTGWGATVEIDASLGWALFPTDGATSDELLARAPTGRCTPQAGNRRSAPRRLDGGIVREFELALESREVVVHYQPVLELRSGAVRTVEALVRRQHPDRGVLSPAEFLPRTSSAHQSSAPSRSTSSPRP